MSGDIESQHFHNQSLLWSFFSRSELEINTIVPSGGELKLKKKKKFCRKDIAPNSDFFLYFDLNGTTYQEDLQFQMHNNARNAK